MSGHPTNRAILAEQIVEVLSESGPAKARSIAGRLRDRGVLTDKSQINSVLYSQPRFAPDASVPPTWHISEPLIAEPETPERAPYLIEGIGLTNWKAFAEAGLALAPLTLLYGENSAGKSSLIQALLLLKQSWRHGSLVYESPGATSFAFHHRVVHAHDVEIPMRLAIMWRDGSIAISASRDERWMFGPAQPIDTFIFSSGSQLFACKAGGENLPDDPEWRVLSLSRPEDSSVPEDPLLHESAQPAPSLLAIAPCDQQLFPDLSQARPVEGEKEALRDADRAMQQADHAFGSIIHIGPVRSVPARDMEVSSLRSEGSYMARLYEDPHLRDDVNLWLSKFEIPYSLAIEDYGLGEFGLKLSHNDGAEKVDLADVGFGVSQLLPIVVQLIGERDRTILIEEPEAHVHPRLQSVLGDLFVESMQDYRNTLLVETHSEPILLRLQRRIADKRLNPDEVSVTHVEREDGASHLTSVEIRNDGQLDYQWPGGFFDNRMEDLVAILDPASDGGS